MRTFSALLATAVLATAPTLAAGQAVPSVTLDEAVRRALDVAPAVVGALTAVDNASANLLQARGALFPSLNVNGIWANSSNERFDQATGQLVSESYTAQLQSSYEVFGGGRRILAMRSAGAVLDATESREVAQRFTTVLQTTELFYQAAASEDLVDVAEQRLERAGRQLDFARTRLEVGTATRSDLLRAEIENGNAEMAVVDARAAARTAGLELGRQIGEATEVRPALDSLPGTSPDIPALEALVARAERTSPRVVAAQASLRSSKAERLEAWTPYLPSLRLTGGYDWFSFDFPPQERSWSMRAIASFPVFNGFQRESALRRAGAAERLAEVEARDAALEARVAVESAVLGIQAAVRRVEISDRTVELAREDLRVQEERYPLGVSTILELQASQLALTDAEVAAVRARRDLGSSVARLEAVLGESLR